MLTQMTPSSPGAATVVLVHGAFADSSSFNGVIARLQAQGYPVVAIANPLRGLNADSAYVASVLKSISGPIVLVGHSYGGFIISGVAEKVAGKIGSIVFLDAFVPEGGDSLATTSSQPVREAIAAAQGRGEHALKPVPASVFRVNEADRPWVDGKCTPHPIGTLIDKVALTGARDKIAKKSYIRAKGYPSIPFDAALAKTKESGWKTFEMTAGHDAMVDQPQELTDILLQVA